MKSPDFIDYSVRLNAYRPTTTATAIDTPSAKKAAYQVIKPENQASGQRRRIRTAHNSPAGLSTENETARAITLPIVPRNIRIVLVFYDKMLLALIGGCLSGLRVVIGIPAALAIHDIGTRAESMHTIPAATSAHENIG